MSSSEYKQGLASGDMITVMTSLSAKVIRLELMVDDRMQYTTLNVHEAEALILVLQAAANQANVYTVHE